MSMKGNIILIIIHLFVTSGLTRGPTIRTLRSFLKDKLDNVSTYHVVSGILVVPVSGTSPVESYSWLIQKDRSLWSASHGRKLRSETVTSYPPSTVRYARAALPYARRTCSYKVL